MTIVTYNKIEKSPVGHRDMFTVHLVISLRNKVISMKSMKVDEVVPNLQGVHQRNESQNVPSTPNQPDYYYIEYL